MGVMGGLVTIPLNTVLSWWLKRDEQLYKHRLDMIAKQRELLLQHELEMKRKGKDDDIYQLKRTISKLEMKVAGLERIANGK
ncbi:hypothetical protein ANRL3_00837 [Anaerolineae bacterium]|nr:hypothetical protein ANRL3_00837 [Anaerolineae bacterium]